MHIEINSQNYEIDLKNPLDISIPLNFDGGQPNAYGVEKAVSKPCAAGELIGDTRRGGSCNFEQITFIPHCNGTHTECVGHITRERIFVRDCLKDAFISSSLISVEPENAGKTSETYALKLSENDKLITRKSIEKAIRSSRFEVQGSRFEVRGSRFEVQDAESLIVRTLPNDESKLTATYLENIPPFFSTEAMRYIFDSGIKHLLVDTPSIDRIFDEGKLSNHRIFWNIEQGSFETNESSKINSTITELIYVSNEIEDGAYLLNLQIAPFAADASPSRPLLFKLFG